MKLTQLLTLLLALTLLIAPVAMADDEGEETDDADDDSGAGSHGRGPKENKTHEDDANETDNDSNETDDDNESDDGPRVPKNKSHSDDDNETDAEGGRNETRIAERAAAKEARTSAIQAFVAAIKELRVSWLEHAAEVREDCKAAKLDDRANATREERTAHAQCIKAGYSEWRAERVADMKELRAQLREALSA